MQPIRSNTEINLEKLAQQLNAISGGNATEALESDVNYGAWTSCLTPDYKDAILSDVKRGDPIQMRFRAGLMKDIARKLTEIAGNIENLAGGTK